MLELAVIIVSFNTRDLLRACLASLAPDAPAEVWVVENGSRDGSPEMVAREFPDVRLLLPGANLGFAAATNLALAQTTQPFICLLNPDTIVHDRALTALVRFLQERPQVAVVGPQLLNPDGSYQHSAFRFPGLLQALLDLEPIHPRLLNSALNGRYPLGQREPFAIDHPLGACLVVRREAITQVGPLDASFFMYCEEIDWCWRMKRAGWQVYCLPTARVTHVGGASTRPLRAAMLVELYRSRLRLYDRYHRPLTRWLYRRLIRWGLRRQLARAERQHRRGALSAEELAAQRQASQQIVQLVR
ncbi:MAG: glycosyltransferase family 2 protein [Chloroflexi bacterium]|nr:glycosyltransferase family 2 protein [Chloroflexota bacterium]